MPTSRSSAPGLTGLWTAFYLRRRDPSLRIVILEREIAGFGASGRNGAWCAPDLNISMSRLARLHGMDRARAMQQATYDAVDEVARATTEAGVENGGFQRGGALLVARGPHGVPSLEDAFEEYEQFRLRRPLPPARRRGDRGQGPHRGRRSWAVHRQRGGHRSRAAGARPRAGGRAPGGIIYEGAAVTEFRQRDAIRHGDAGHCTGEVRAPAIVLAGEAYLTQASGVPPPTPAALLADRDHRAALGRPVGGDRLGRARVRLLQPPVVDYLSRTADGRSPSAAGCALPLRRQIRDEYDRTTRPTGVSVASCAPGSPACAMSASPTPGAGRSGSRATGTRP